MESRTKHGVRNISAGLFNKFLLMVLPFITRTILNSTLGSEYLGLSSLFTSILTVLNLTELGFGSALVYSMYRPVSEGNNVKVGALLRVYKRVYTIIGLVVLLMGILATPFVPMLIEGDMPRDTNVYILYLIYVSNTAVSYLLFAYKRALLLAYQRYDIATNVNTVVNGLLCIVQSIVLLLFRNYYIYIVFLPICTILENLLTTRAANKCFPAIKCEGEISKEEKGEIKNHIKGLALQNICSASRNALDSIAISMYLGLHTTAVYNNYFYIMNAVHAILYQIPNALRATVGNQIVTQSQKDNYKMFNSMTILYQWISGWCLCCLMCLYQPFMEIWMGKGMLLPLTTVILFGVYFFELCMSDIIALYKDGAGLWWHGKYRTIIEAVANLILNFTLGYFWGINGILIATIVTMTLIGHGYGGYIVFRYYFSEERYSSYVTEQLKYFAISAFVCAVTYCTCMWIPLQGILCLLVRGGICAIIPNVLFFVILRKHRYFYDAMELVKNILGTYIFDKFKKK